MHIDRGHRKGGCVGKKEQTVLIKEGLKDVFVIDLWGMKPVARKRGKMA